MAAETNFMKLLERIDHGLYISGALEAQDRLVVLHDCGVFVAPAVIIRKIEILRSSLRSPGWRKVVENAGLGNGNDCLIPQILPWSKPI